MGRVRRVLRWVLVGRRDGLRATVRRQFGWLSWLDRDPTEPASTSPAHDADAPIARDDGWLNALGTTELAPGEVTEVIVGGRAVAIANVGGVFHAVSDTCPHAGGPLGEGFLDGSTLTCPLHGWTFDVGTGECHIDPDERLERFGVEVRGDRVFVEVAATSE
ncbi:MAG: nitrite reductase (NADH) small subunit [Myxococcota bacterium]|jgi:nitrite reductase (NADH) small subunit